MKKTKLRGQWYKGLKSHLEDLESSNIQHTNEVLSLGLGVQGLVDSGNQPLEHTIVHGLGKGGHCVHNLVFALPLGHELRTNLHLEWKRMEWNEIKGNGMKLNGIE